MISGAGQTNSTYAGYSSDINVTPRANQLQIQGAPTNGNQPNPNGITYVFLDFLLDELVLTVISNTDGPRLMLPREALLAEYLLKMNLAQSSMVPLFTTVLRVKSQLKGLKTRYKLQSSKVMPRVTMELLFPLLQLLPPKLD